MGWMEWLAGDLAPNLRGDVMIPNSFTSRKHFTVPHARAGRRTQSVSRIEAV